MEMMDEYTKAIVFLAKRRALEELKGDYTSLGARVGIKGFVKGFLKGFRDGCKRDVIEIFSKSFPHESISCLENLTIQQYGEIFDLLLEGEELEEIIKIIAN